MLYMCVHTHSPETCLAGNRDKAVAMRDGLYQAADKAGVRIVSHYVAPQEHTVYLTVEVPDDKAFRTMLADPSFEPWLHWGNARFIPVLESRPHG